MSQNLLRSEILELVRTYVTEVHAAKPFIPGESPVPVSGRVFDHKEITYLVESALDFWLTIDRFNDSFERGLSNFLGIKFALTTNSGSSANLLATAALMSPLLGKDALKPGDEVITTACAFPTTVNPILQHGLVPVFVDVALGTYNADVEQIERSISQRTRAIVLAHTLGNPFDLSRVLELANRHHLWLIEDCCDALGSTYRGKKVGSFGHMSTVSFYPAHQITTGEGGAIFTNDAKLKRIIQSLRDWGRDCWCKPGDSNTCGKRFSWQFDRLPSGYDHKYIYSQAGYHLSMTDLQAAIGVAQLEKLPSFVAARKENFRFLRESLDPLAPYFILPQPTEGSDPSWFGFPLTIREGAPFSRNQLVQYLDKRKIATRPFFAGNITCQPYFSGYPYKTAGPLENSDFILKNSFWLGVFPGLNKEALSFSVSSIQEFIEETCLIHD